jgi:ABC-type lipoprotein release transport system permease subunit
MDQFWVTGFSEQTMPEDYVHRLASHTGLSYVHLLPTLKRRTTWRNQEVILVGVLPEISPVDKPKPSMSFQIDRGSVYVGYEIARHAGLTKGDKIDILGKSFIVAVCLPENGSNQDISIFCHLHDAQTLVNTDGRINEIQALNCVCFDSDADALAMLRRQLARALPEAKVIQIRPIAEARQNQRQMMEDYLAIIVPFVLVVCAAWIGLLAMLNVRERLQEIGIMRALGYGSSYVASLFLGKAVTIGIVGAVVGFGLGTVFAMLYGPGMFKVTGNTIKPMYELLLWSIVLAPAFAAMATAIPAMIAVAQDPATTLRAE